MTQQDRKFIAYNSCRHVLRIESQRQLDLASSLNQKHVADAVAEPVIHTLELIQVNHQERETAASIALAQPFVQHVEQETAAVQPGELIAVARRGDIHARACESAELPVV